MSVAESGHNGAQSASTTTSSSPSSSSSSSSSTDRFRFLRSLRDLLFGRRRQRPPRRAVLPATDGVAGAAVPRVKSSRSLSDELESRAPSMDSHPASADASASSIPAAAATARLGAPYKKLKSISTGDLLDTGKNADWLLKCTSPDSMERRVILAVSTADPDDYRFTDLTSSSDNSRQTHSVSTAEDLSDQDFFSVGWLERPSTEVIADESHDDWDTRDVTDSLDVVSCRQSLDVSLLKDRLAVKQKGKRQATGLQSKVSSTRQLQAASEHDTGSALFPVSESIIDSDVTESTSRDDDVTSASVHARSCSDSGTDRPSAARRAVTPSSQAGAVPRVLVTDNMLTDAMRRVRPTAAGAAEVSKAAGREATAGARS